MVRFKAEVRVSWLDERLIVPLQAACVWSLRSRVDVEVNSIEDLALGRTPGTLHGFGLAIDFDTVFDKVPDIEALGEWFRRTLPAGYDVVFEGTHVHVEWDVHRPALRKVVS